MARYNTSLASATITGATTIGTPNSGAFTALTGTAPYTVTLPPPSLFPGTNQTFYNSTGGIVTISTPSGNFVGTGASGTSSNSIFAGNVVSVTSDGTNYIVISEDGSSMTATTGAFSSNVTVAGTLTVQSSGGVVMAPASAGTIDNVSIGSTARASGAFTSLAANGQVNFTAGTASSSTSTGTLVVTGGLGVSGNINATNVTANLTGTIQTAAQPNITSLGTLTSLTSTGNITISNTSGYVWGSSYAFSPSGNHVPQATGFLTATGGTTYPAGWYRIARSAIQSGGNGQRGGTKITVASTGGYLGPLQDVIYLFKDWTTSGQIGRVENFIGSYFSRYRLVMDANYSYLEGYLTNSLNLGGTSGWQCTSEPYSGNWSADNWTIYNETLTAGLVSPTASYTIPVFGGGMSIRRLLIDRESESSGSSTPSLEIRVNGGINTGNYDGIFFTQSIDGTTPLGSIRLANKNSGAPDFEFWTRNGSSEAQRFIFSNAGKLGIGVTPSSQLHVVSSGTEATLSVTNNSATGYAFGIGKLGESYSTGTSSVTPYEVAGTLGNFVALPNGVNTGAILTFNAYNSSNGATGAYIGAVAGPTGNGPASVVIGRRTGTSAFAESVRIDTSGNTTISGWTRNTGTVNVSTVGANSASGNTIGSYVLGNGRWWNTAGGAQYIHFLLPSRYNQNNSLMWCLEIKGYDFAAPRIINVMIGGYVTPPSNGGPMSRVAVWDATSAYSPTAYYSSNYACGVARIYMPDRYYASFTVNSIASGNGDIIAPDELRIFESANSTI